MFEQELQLLLAKYPEIEDVSFTCKKTVKRGAQKPVLSAPVVPQNISPDFSSLQGIAAMESNKAL